MSRAGARGGRARLTVWALAAALALCLPASADAGQIVYAHAGDLWVMNDDGGGQRPLLTQAQAGATELSQPNLLPTGGALAFQGDTPAPDGTCDTNCVSILTLIDGVVHRITPAPVDCVHAAAVSCLETDDNGPTLTADGRVLYLHSGAMVTYGCGVYYCGGGSTVGNQYTIGSDVGGDQPNTWPTGPPDSWSAPATQGGYAFSPAADPADAQLIAYPGFEDPASPSWTVNPLVIDDDAALSPFVVSDDDVTQSAVTWSPDGSYVLDIEGGANPGIWAYTARPYTATGWKAYYVLAPPPQTAEGGGLGNGLAITGDGRVLFTSGHEIYSLPSGCGPVGDAAAPTTGTPIPNCTLAQATQLTTDASSEEPTWTALTTPLSYTPPTTPGPPVPPLPPGRLVPPVPPLPPVPPQHPDELRSVGLAQRTVRSGAPVTFEVRLGASSKIVVEILRLVPASGHGRHRHRARYRLVGTDTFAGKHGLDRLRVIKLHGRRLAPGGYEARVSAGGRAHVVKFKVRR